MDYLEGFLIGSVWSDTDYTSRRHFNAHVFLAAVMAVAFVVLVLFPEKRQQLILVKWPAALILLIFFIILTPLVSLFYRRLPFYIKPLALFFYAFKYLLLFYVLTHYFLPLVTFEKESILVTIFGRVDHHIETALEVIAESGGILATVGGVLAGGLWVIGEGLALIGMLLLIPLLAIVLMKGLQYALDYLVKFLLDKQLAEMDILASADIPWKGELDELELPGPAPVPANPEGDTLKPAAIKEDRSVEEQASSSWAHFAEVFRKKISKGITTLGKAFRSFGSWCSALAGKLGGKIKQAAGSLKARVKDRPEKQKTDESKGTVSSALLKWKKDREPVETVHEDDS